MPTPTPPTHSTPLERLSFDREGAKFELDGRPVRLNEAADPASFAAFQSLYQWALADFEARRKAEVKPGWLARLKSWVGRWLQGPGAGAAAARPEAAPAPASIPRPAVIPPLLPTAPVRPAPAAGAKPEMRAVFGDRGGLRVIWEVPGAGREKKRDVECQYPLDSELAGRLQECYGHLNRLGYRVVGLDLKPGVAPDHPEKEAEGAPIKVPRPKAAPAAPREPKPSPATAPEEPKAKKLPATAPSAEPEIELGP